MLNRRVPEECPVGAPVSGRPHEGFPTHNGATMRTFWSKWGLCLLLFLATTLNYLDRQTLSILAPTLQDEMHLDNEALGWLFSVFYYSYTFSMFAVGFLLDRAHLRWAFGLAVLAWSTVSALTS